MEETSRTGAKTNKLLILLLKLAVTVACLWYISGKIDFEKAGNSLQSANWLYLFIALLFFILSKLISAYRLNIYFKNIGIHLPQWTNIKLYWLGMFYNLFLPGSIGGDAYKVILLTRKYQVPYRKTTAAVLLDRFSGLIALGLILAVYGFEVLDNMNWSMFFAAGAVLSVVVLYLVTRFFFSYLLPGFLSTFLLGIAVQVSQVISVYFIMSSLGLSLTEHAWIFIFLAAAVVTVLPLSLGGGLGTREFVFREGALLFSLDPDIAVVISLLFYLCTLLGSLPGIIYIFKNPLNR